MIDTHTHILAHMDDGAHHTSDSIDMLRAEREQGVDCVVLTSHFYATRESSESYLHRREDASFYLESVIGELSAEEQGLLADRILGAEVAWHPSLLDDPNLSELCIGSTKYILIEPPVTRWDHNLISQMYDLIGCRGLTPIIAHIDRYLPMQSREVLNALYSMGIPIQISADAFLSFWLRSQALRLVQNKFATLLISDCHGMTHRKPNIAQACAVIEKKLGQDAVKRLEDSAQQMFRP